MKRFVLIVNNISEKSGIVLALLIWGTAGIVLYDVLIARIIFTPTIWAVELSCFVYGAFAVLSGAYVLRHRAHVNMDVFYNRLPLRGKAILDVITFPLFLLFCGVMLWEGWEFGWRSIQRWEISWSDWGPPVWPIKSTIFIAAFLLMLQGMAKFASDLFIIISGKEVEQ